ncbi:MAG: conjugal transfer protein TraG N-terminal domain-containing protein [Pseudomonadota bacterium]
MEFTIYSIGDSLFLEQVLIALAMIAGVPDFADMIKIGLLLGVFSAVISAIAKGGREIEFQHVLLGYIIYATMFIPTARVLIEDTYSGAVRVVDNVPMGAAAAGGIISLVGYKVTELFEVAYGPIVPKITDTQFAESLQILNTVRKKATDPAIWQGINADLGGGFIDVRRSYSNYMRSCTLKKIDLGIMHIDDLYKGQYTTVLQFDSPLFTTEVFLQSGNPAGQSRTCREAWADLTANALGGPVTEDALKAILGYDATKLAPGETTMGKITTASDALLGSAINANTYLTLAVLEPIMAEAASGKYNELNDFAGATMINQAIQQRNSEWAAEQTLFMTIVRPMLAFFEAFIYAIAPIMAFVIVLGAKGIALAGKYFTMLIWIQLWMPLLAIVNLYIHTAARSRFDGYTAVATHNWDSFYALDTASDITQHWLATGGLLAASTPAIALMLIYGSAVTATHLAGRLKGSDHINENIQSPDIASAAPMHQIASQYSGNMTSGLIQTGAESSIGTASIGATFSNSTQSAHGLVNSENQQFTESLAQSFNANQSADELHSKMSSMGAMVSSGKTATAQFANNHAKQFMQDHKVSRDHQEAFTGAAAMSAHMGANFDIDKAAGALHAKTGIARSAIKGFLQKAGVMEEPGKGLATIKDKGDGGNVVDINAGARLSGTSTSTTSDRNSESSANSSSNSSGFRFEESERQAFNKELTSKIDSQNGESFKKSWGSSDSSEVRKASSELSSANRSYQESQSLMNTMGSLSNMKMHEVGALAAGRNQGDFKGDKSAEQMLDNSWASQPEAVKQHANDLQNRYMRFGMSQDVAKNTARLTALTDQNNFKDNEAGQANATQLAARVIQQATGHGGENIDYNANQNSNLNGPEIQSNEIKDQASNLNGPDMRGQDAIKQNALRPNTSVVNDQSQLNESVISNDADTNKDNLINNSANAESQASASAISKAESRVVNNATEMGLGVQAASALTNSMDWASRRIDQIGGGTGAFLNEASSQMGDAFESYKNMTPEQQQQFQQGLKDQDAALFDQLGVAGLPVKGAQMLGNQIIGASVTGYEALRGNEDFSQATQNMSWQEKGAFWAAASGEAANQGATSLQQFMTDHGAQFKSDMQEYGMQAYNLTPEQAAVYAESYDTNPAAMRTAVNNLEKPYAVQDEQGNPQWDDANNRWELSPEKREFTNAMVNTLTDSGDAGSHAGSYLGSIQAYNVANERVTPSN